MMHFVHRSGVLLLAAIATITSGISALALPGGAEAGFSRRQAQPLSSQVIVPVQVVIPDYVSQVQTLPNPLAQRIRQDIQRRFGIPARRINIATAQRRTWDACLGVAPPQRACAQIAISGWQVVAASGTGFWVYHISEDGQRLALNAVASSPRNRSLPIPQLLDANGRIPTSGARVVFQSAMTTGFAPGYYAIELRADGRLTRRQIAPQPSTAQPTVLKRLSPQQVEQFMAIVERNRFHHFNGISYFDANRVAADAASFQLSDGSHTLEYTQVDPNTLPVNLRRIVTAWNQLVD